MESRRAPELFAHLAHRGIWVRRFQHDPGLLRFGQPGSETAWHRLEQALHTFVAA
jgi:cobalamin biosynthetic protein CobC